MSDCSCQLPKVPTYNANCLAAQPDLAPCQVRRIFADESLGRVSLTRAVLLGENLERTNIIFPGFAAAARVCFRAITITVNGSTPVPVDVVRIAAVRLYRKPDGSWAWARSEWSSEQATLVQATSGRCACTVACKECVGPLGGFVLQFEHEAVAVGDAFKATVEYKAESTSPCCNLDDLCGEEELTPIPYGESPEFYD